MSRSKARPMEMRGREMAGWLRVDAEVVQAEDELAAWVARGIAYARSLPAKQLVSHSDLTLRAAGESA